MSANNPKLNPQCSAEQIDEAAVWIAMLHGPDRTAKLERGFRRWLAANPAHAEAFEKISTAWEVTGALPRGPFPHLSRWQRAGFRAGFARAAGAVAAVAVVAALGVVLYLRTAGVATDIGEQRMLALEDGTRIYLNTDTRVFVDYDERVRRVELRKGEALFEVAKQARSRPFVVAAGNREITALGTSFVVRRDEERLSVTLVEGVVSVAAVGDGAVRSEPATTLKPGQRLVLTTSAQPRLDQPPLEKLTAWRGGHVDFDDVTLADAAAEMNRYSTTKLSIERAEAAGIRVTGIFRAGDTSSFAAAVARTYELEVVEKPRLLLLAGMPATPAEADPNMTK